MLFTSSVSGFNVVADQCIIASCIATAMSCEIPEIITYPLNPSSLLQSNIGSGFNQCDLGDAVFGWMLLFCPQHFLHVCL